MTSLKTSMIAAAAIVALSLPTLATAADTRSVTVAYADLDLATPAGAATLDRRIRLASIRVCGPVALGEMKIVGECRARARHDAGVVMAARAVARDLRLASAH